MRPLLVCCIAALLIASSAAAQSGVTGNWTGTYTYSIQLSACQNKTFTSSGSTTVTFLQTGNAITGRIDLANFLIFGGSCTPTPTEITSTIVGTVDGSSVAWTFPNDSNVTQFTGSIDGGSINAQISDDNGATGSLTISRTAGDAPAVDATGSWSGNYSFTDKCSNGATKAYTGTFALAVSQTGANATGVVTMTNVPLYDQSCRTITPLTMTMAVGGTVAGATFSGGVVEPAGSFEFPISATVSGASMSGTVTGANGTGTTGTFTLNRDSAAPPVTDLSGSYEGTYRETDNEAPFCFNIGTLTFDGAASVSIVRAGDAVSGWLIFHDAQDIGSDGFGGCFVVNIGDNVLPLYGTLSANALTLLLPLGGGVQNQFTVTFTSDGLTGTVADTIGDFGSFSATKTAAGVSIDSFTASPAAIVVGQSTTLTWSTSNTTSVSIDHGIGAQPASGSVTVFPAATTVYTLTATGASGTVTAQTTVTVSPPVPRRRAVQ